MNKIYFWQRMITPHMSALALELSKNGQDIIYVAETPLSRERANLGWKVPDLGNIQICFAKNYNEVKSIILKAPSNSIHICQGIRNNGIVSFAQKELRKKKLRQWVIMETVNINGFFGFIKNILYRTLIKKYQKDIEIILAIGWKTSSWLIQLGFDSKKVFSFTYFLPPSENLSLNNKKKSSLFHFVFVGGLVLGKRLDLLILALSKIKKYTFKLIIVGDGPCKISLEEYSRKLIPNSVIWKGVVHILDVRKILSESDCLVLPSNHDGWGAVISEAMIEGTPAICSDACGAAGVVKLSKFGGVFKRQNLKSLIYQINSVLKKGRVSNKKRYELSKWSNKISSKAGSKYLLNIIKFSDGLRDKPNPPWI